MSQNEQDAEKKKEAQRQKAQAETPQPAAQQPSPKPEPAPTAPTAAPAAVPKPQAVVPPRPVTPPAAPTVAPRPLTPVAPAAPRPVTPTAAAAPRPAVAAPAVAGKPTVPPKREESKSEVSRRNFLKGLAVLGGLVAIGQFAAFGPFLQGSVGNTQQPTQVILDAETSQPIKTTDVKENDWKTFVWPRTGNPNIDNDTFSQCVVIHLPKGLTAPSDLSAKDPISGDTFIAFSRVCVHLWCLWSYVPGDQRMECPCHGSQYVPGTGAPYNKPPGMAVAGPAFLQTPPNNQLPIILLSISQDGSISAKGIVGQVGCGQLC